MLTEQKITRVIAPTLRSCKKYKIGSDTTVPRIKAKPIVPIRHLADENLCVGAKSIVDKEHATPLRIGPRVDELGIRLGTLHPEVEADGVVFLFHGVAHGVFRKNAGAVVV